MRQLLYLNLLCGLLIPHYGLANPSKNTYTVDTKKTNIDILVFKGGVLASFGHNHLISVGKINGQLVFNSTNPLKSEFKFTIPIHALVIDDSNRRKQYSKYFSNPINAGAKQATRRNMLKKIFNAKKSPTITIQSSAISGTAPNYKIHFWITINGVKRRLTSTVILLKKKSSISVKGNLPLDLKNFKIKPFSGALGTIKIQNTLRINFNFYLSKIL